jgi:hypothetical protein
MVALFWTLPASAAALVYRAHDYSIDNVKASLKNRLGTVEKGLEKPQPQFDAS